MNKPLPPIPFSTSEHQLVVLVRQNAVQSGPDLPTGLSLGQGFIASIRPAWGIEIRRWKFSTTPPIHLF